MLKKEMITCLKLYFATLMHDGTMQIKMCTISHKIRAVFCQLLILNFIETTPSIFKMYMSSSTKKNYTGKTALPRN